MHKSVLLVTSEFPPGPGGIGRHAFDLALHLKAEGYSVKVLTEERKEYAQAIVTNLEVKYFQRLSVLSSLYFSICIMTRLLSAPKIIIASGRKALVASFFGLLMRHKVIAIIHGHELLMGSKWTRSILAFILNRYTYLVAVSEFSKSVGLNGINNTRIKVIPNGISLASGRENNPRTPAWNELNLLTVGTISRRKGQQNVLRLLPELINLYPFVRYTMAGGVREPESVFPIIDSLKLASYVQVKGVVSAEELESLYKKADIFIMLSENQPNGDVEGFGIAILEANSFGVPVIGSIGCGIEDAIQDGFNGFLIRLNDQKRFAEAIHKIISNYSFYSNNAVKWAMSHDWKKVVKEYVSLLELVA